MENMIIRTATANDAEAILNIYAYYVENTAITFEYDVPTLEEFTQRTENTLKKYPYLVAKSVDGFVLDCGDCRGVGSDVGATFARYCLPFDAKRPFRG